MELWTLTVARGFAENYSVTEEIIRIMKVFGLSRGMECYLAGIDGKVAGGAALSLRGKIAGLFGASALPDYRKRGVQTAAGATMACGRSAMRNRDKPRAARQPFTEEYQQAEIPGVAYEGEVWARVKNG